MSQQTVPSETLTTQTALPREPTAQATRLLVCGILAGPLFVVVVLIQEFTRDGFDPSYHPLSLLSLGDLGWIQIVNFVVTGVLYVACAAGMRPALRAGRAATWGPLLVGALGVGLIAAGVFVTDAGAGFPPGAPAGAPERISWHGIGHEVGFIVALLSWTAACFVFVRRFAALKRRGWVAACVAAPVAVFVLESWLDLDSLSVRILIGTAIMFGSVAAVAARLVRGLPHTAATSLAA
jgi:hypothetical protein